MKMFNGFFLIFLFSCAASETNSAEMSSLPESSGLVFVDSGNKKTNDKFAADAWDCIIDRDTNFISEFAINEGLPPTTVSAENNLEESQNKKELKTKILEVKSNNELIAQKSFPDFSSFDNLLQKAVSSKGVVNYNIIASNRTVLITLIDALQESTPNNSWSKNEKLTYWINMYNALTLDLIADKHPVSSIKDINGGKPWDLKLIEIAGKSLSLNQIENEIIRPRFKDPRIHFAVNCAAFSCPKLHNRAFTPDNLQNDLSALTKSFLSNEAKNQLSAQELKISKIFEWYADDFGNLREFISKYSAVDVSPDSRVIYNDYDWQLND